MIIPANTIVLVKNTHYPNGEFGRLSDDVDTEYSDVLEWNVRFLTGKSTFARLEDMTVISGVESVKVYEECEANMRRLDELSRAFFAHSTYTA